MALEEDNRSLKQMYANLIKSGARSTQGYYRKIAGLEERRELAKQAVDEQGLSERQACRPVNLNRCTYLHQARKTDDHEIVQEWHHLAQSQPGWGCGRMSNYLRNQVLTGTTSEFEGFVVV